MVLKMGYTDGLYLYVTPHSCQVQYRMHPSLSAFPNQRFYSGRLADGVVAEQRIRPHGFPWPSAAHPVAFVHVKGHEETVSGGSKMNRTEGQLLVQVIGRVGGDEGVRFVGEEQREGGRYEH